jgi:site-specific recombinase XerD
MRAEKRTNRDGSHYYSFVTADRKRLSREYVRNRFGRDITSEEDAKQTLKLLDAEFEAKKYRISQRLDWEKQFYNFKALLDDFVKKQKKRAPNSWQNNEFYCRHYVLYYFLQVKKLNNIELWVDHYDDFVGWLEKAKRVKSDKVIAVSSKNHAIKALNIFMKHLHEKNIVTTYRKCEVFGQHLVNERTLDDVISDEEMERIFKRLQKLGYDSEALYFRYLYVSGMRFNEGLCISADDIFQDEIKNDLLRRRLENAGIKPFGHIVSEGQFGGVKSSGEVVRLPFKGKKKIEEKHNRIIPISDKILWNALVGLIQEKLETWPEKKTLKDCLLFGGINDATATRRLQEAFKAEKLRWRSWHCLRHSRATHLIGATGDEMLARLILGHSSPRTLEKYNHIYQSMARTARSVGNSRSKLRLRKV